MQPEDELGKVVEEATKIVCETGEKMLHFAGYLPVATLEALTWGEINKAIIENRKELRKVFGAATIAAFSFALMSSN